MNIKVLSKAEFTAGIPALRKSAEDLTASIHQYAVSALDHAREDGDYRSCLALLNALPNSQRVQGLAEWFRHFSSKKLILKKVKGVWDGEIRKDRTVTDFLMEEAAATTYADFTAEPEVKQVTLKKLLAMVERIANDDEILKDGKRKVPDNVAAVAAQMIAAVADARAAA